MHMQGTDNRHSIHTAIDALLLLFNTVIKDDLHRHHQAIVVGVVSQLTIAYSNYYWGECERAPH